jgi:hypothetical protein
MKIEVVNSQISFVGKMKELAKAERAIGLMASELSDNSPRLGDNSQEEDDYMDIGFLYEQDEYTIAEIKFHWKNVKKLL